jgi:hypothetical protein
MDYTYDNEHLFWQDVRERFEGLMAKQMPWLEQATPMYSFMIELAGRLAPGTVVIKPGKNEYYSISDADLHVTGKDERAEFMFDLLSSGSAFEFLARHIKNYKIPVDQDPAWARVLVFK